MVREDRSPDRGSGAPEAGEKGRHMVSSRTERGYGQYVARKLS
jgi:hypothetical protein